MSKSLVKTLVVFFLVCVFKDVAQNIESFTDDDDDDIGDPNIFRPTEYWQEIKEGQSIPRGLHVRMNLQTGLKEAKLMEEDTDTEPDGTIQASDTQSDEDGAPRFYGHSDRRGVINKATKLFTRDELSEMLRKLKDDGPKGDHIPLLSGEPSSGSESSDTVTSIPIEEIRQLVTFHSEVQLMLQYLQVLMDPDSNSEDLIKALDELEYYVHQIDNARDFDLLGGLAVVIRFLNHTNTDVQSSAALVLGAATQGNPEVQKQVLTYQAIPILLPLLSSSTPEILQRRVLYALGSLLRGHPSSVEEFITRGGIEMVSEEIEKRSEIVIVKIMTLITDLLSFEGLEEKTNISLSDLLSQLSDLGWCYYTPQLLNSDTQNSIDKSLVLMEKIIDVCDFSKHLSILDSLHRKLNIDQNITDDDTLQILKLVHRIIYKLKTTKQEL